MIVLDTNVLSESLRPAPSKVVLDWLARQNRREVFTAAITQAELLYGIEGLPVGKRRLGMLAIADRIFNQEFSGRILPFDEKAAQLYAVIMRARESMGRPISELDAMIAAIVRSRDATVATRNVKDFAHCGIRIVNPWTD